MRIFSIQNKIGGLLCLMMMSGFAAASSDTDDGLQWNVEIAAALISDPSNIIGAEQKDASNYLGATVILDLYYKGFFIESNRHRLNYHLLPTDIGYELVSAEDYEIDLLARSYIKGFNERSAGLIFDKSIEELKGIDSRDEFLLQGLRYTAYLNEDVYWLSFGIDILDGVHHGWVLDGFYASTYHLRNWDVQLGAGATVFSANMNQYYFGVETHEISENRPYYSPNAGYRGELEISGRYPISESWLLTTGLTLSHYSKSIFDSPLTTRRNVLRYVLSVSYVF
ncbi:MipA/OmpV family protein [Agaribacter flavus]